jgi:hemerythrin-like domain-containing protein
MDILDLIKQDHDKTLDAFESLKKTTEKTFKTREKTWSETEEDLLAHMQAEEETLYPALEKDEEDKILEAIEEHNLARMASEDLDDTPIDDKRWLAKLKVIEESVKHHIEEEEGEIFKAARKNLSDDERQEMGDRFKEVKEENLSRK